MATAATAAPVAPGTQLPRHAMATETPQPSEVTTLPSGETAYAWKLMASESAHIAQMLSVDVSEITLDASYMDRERDECRTCGKYMGLDDLVHNALYGGIHGGPFILDVLQNGPRGQSPAHVVFCSRCVTKHEHARYWAVQWI